MANTQMCAQLLRLSDEIKHSSSRERFIHTGSKPERIEDRALELMKDKMNNALYLVGMDLLNWSTLEPETAKRYPENWILTPDLGKDGSSNNFYLTLCSKRRMEFYLTGQQKLWPGETFHILADVRPSFGRPLVRPQLMDGNGRLLLDRNWMSPKLKTLDKAVAFTANAFSYALANDTPEHIVMADMEWAMEQATKLVEEEYKQKK